MTGAGKMTEPAPAPPQPRPGPRPLGLHLGAGTWYYLTSLSALPGLRRGWINWSPELRERAAALREALPASECPGDNPDDNPGAAADHDAALARAVERQARADLTAMLDGIERYRRHPYRREGSAAICAWQEGGSRLLHFPARKSAKRPGGRARIFIVPSLINRYYILDLASGRSFAGWLAAQGLDVFVMDWGDPGEGEAGFTLDAYIARLERALLAAQGHGGERDRPLTLAGYCMGGLLALALALRRPERIARLILMATPWDFHAGGGDDARALAVATSAMAPFPGPHGMLPVDLIQALFAALDPCLAMVKFAKFSRIDPDSAAARRFVALEDWLNDGTPLSGPVARECLVGWYGENRPAQGCWQVDGTAVTPAGLRLPCLAVIPDADRIVPPESALALAAALPDCRILHPSAGHIGMMVAAGVETRIWRAVADFAQAG